jgi:hypothetical protein
LRHAAKFSHIVLPFEIENSGLLFVYIPKNIQTYRVHAQSFTHFDAMFPVGPGNTSVVYFGSLNHKGFSIEQELFVSYFEARGFGNVTSSHQANQAHNDCFR